ncbi:hypothetical protein MNBD_GAMMA26-572 [hydrothermal vent metagenome]|uniref:Response regulator n=1 Tax=hydrothermal vent metagenome TaxID=652676 RepID=A0A3B1B7J2_9ZZZZ
MSGSTPIVLIIDDNVTNVELLEAYLFASGCKVITAIDGQTGLTMAFEHNPNLILLDIMMPGLDGYEVCKLLKNSEKTRLTPIIMITALTDIEDKIKGLDAGADDFLSKPFNKHELMARVRSLLRIKSLHDDLDSSEDIILTLVLALEAKDPYTKGHSERVATLAASLAKVLGCTEREQDRIHKAGIMHDIGKIGVSGKILSKNDALAQEEYAEVISHPSVGATICQPLKSLADIIPMIKHHHERFDGKGKPDGLVGQEIPLGARIISIADTYDAMTSTRPYRMAMNQEVALGIFQRELHHGQWDGELAAHFIKMCVPGMAQN